MKKNKIYLLISIITLICFFGTAAICNQCAADTVEEVDSAAVEDEIMEEESAEEGEEETLESEEEEEPPEGEEDTEEETAEEEETEEETPEAEEQKEAPTITLEIYEGPTYSSADDVCYYRIKAIVTGNPTPSVVFSKDDSGGAWGSRKTQVNLSDPTETYTLTATATNSEDTATDSIDLNWGCLISNNPPEISNIVFPGQIITPGMQCELEAIATDPDGDTLSYSWSATGGSFNNTTINPVQWTAPGVESTFEVTVIVSDGRGGEASKTESVNVMLIQLPSTVLSIISNNSGFVSNIPTTHVGTIYRIGDNQDNYTYKGFISFDISQLSGSTIETAQLKATSYDQEGDLTTFKPLLLQSAEWQGQAPGFNEGGDIVAHLTHYNFICTSPELKSELQEAVNNNRQNFQVILVFIGKATDNDNANDLWHYSESGIEFFVEYH